MNVPHQYEWMSVKEVARRTGRTRQWVHQRIADGTFRHERKGRRIDVDGQSVTRWMIAEMVRIHEFFVHLQENIPDDQA